MRSIIISAALLIGHTLAIEATSDDQLWIREKKIGHLEKSRVKL